MKKLEVILKTVERCNINCTYCYFFNGGDDSYKFHPPYISLDTIKNTATFLSKACDDFKLEAIQIDFHGGEPTMQKKDQFDAMCQHFYDTLSKKVDLTFALQTNGMLVNDEWIKLFSKYNVSIGVSIDGSKEYNDIARIDHNGNGTYDRVVAGIRKLQQASKEGKVSKISSLSVINTEYPAKEMYRHLVDILNITQFDFLLPDFTHENFANQNPLKYGKYLCNLFDEWVIDDLPNIKVRILRSTLSMLLGRNSELLDLGPENNDMFAFTIASNGDLSPDDTLRTTDPKLIFTNANVNNIDLKEFLDFPIFEALSRAKRELPQKCADCCWNKLCNGGMTINRYSKERIFDNPSVYCEGLKVFYAHVTSYLISKNISFDVIAKNLQIN